MQQSHRRGVVQRQVLRQQPLENRQPAFKHRGEAGRRLAANSRDAAFAKNFLARGLPLWRKLILQARKHLPRRAG